MILWGCCKMFFMKLFGTMSIDIGKDFYLYLKQTKNKSTWVLVDTDSEEVVAVVTVNSSSSEEEGYGNVEYIHRFIELYMNAITKAESKYIYDSEHHLINIFTSNSDGCKLEARYDQQYLESLILSYEGFNVVLTERTSSFPELPKLTPIINQKSEYAIIANLGVKTAAEAKLKFNLDWYKNKKYYSVKTDEEFLSMIEKYVQYVVESEKKGVQVLTGVDTETTGLFTVKLSKDNPAKDWIVAIPFSWEDDISYLIYVRMVYFSNVDANLIQKYFSILFKRNKDFTGQHIDVEVNGNTYSFNRDTICTTGHNTMFDGQSFYSEDIDFFFDEDSMQLGFNLATDWSQGKNSLKSLTRRLFNAETLELEDLFGSKHKDKFAYLQDEELARIYGCADADYSRLVQKKLKALTDKNLYYQYKKYDICLMHLFAIAAAKGMPVDTENIKRLGALVKQDIETIKDFIYRYTYQVINSKTNKNIYDILGKYYEGIVDGKTVELLETAKEMDTDGKYCFKFTPAELKTLLFGILKYPVIKMSEKNQQPALDQFVLKRLMSYQLDTPVDALRNDILSSRTDINGNKVVLIDADKFNSDMYPLARVLAMYADLNKEYTAYYHPIMQNNLEGRMFKSFATARAATRRILNPLQTAKSELKKYYIAPKGQLFVTFDVSQMEYRLMGSISYIRFKEQLQKTYPDTWEQQLEKAPITIIKKKMTSPETDYHIETASMLYAIKPHLVDKTLRKKTKTMGFGIPYGLGKPSLCSALFGTVNKENLSKTQELLDLYNTRQAEIIDTLNSARNQAFIPADISNEFRNYLDIGDTNVSLVRNFSGFYRMFILENLTRSASATIRRKAGNFLIQGGAAELFRRMLYRLYIGCLEAGLDDKVHWLLTVHDELDFLVDEDIDVLKLIEVMYKSCTLVYKDHIPYFIGINFGRNWYEAKSDSAELPVIMVQRLIKQYHDGLRISNDGTQPEVLMQMKHKYMADRIYEEITRVYKKYKENHLIDLTVFDDSFTNYTVRSYIFEFLPDMYKIKNAPLIRYLTFWAQYRMSTEEFNKLIFKTSDNKFIAAVDVYNTIIENAEGSSNDINLEDIVLSDDFILENLEEEEENTVYFGEEAFNEPNADNDDEGVFSLSYNYLDSANDEEYDFIEDFTAKDAHGILKLNKYVRQYINKVGENEYSIMLSGTKIYSNPVEFFKYIKSMGKGNGTLYVVWHKLYTFKNINVSDEILDGLDKIIGGEDAV